MYEEYYDEFEEFDSFEKISHQIPKGFKENKRYKSNQDKYKARRKAKTQEKQRMIEINNLFMNRGCYGK